MEEQSRMKKDEKGKEGNMDRRETGQKKEKERQ